MRILCCALAALGCMFCATAARADSVYNLSLTSTTGNAGNGTGSLDVNVAPSTTGQTTYYANSVTGDILEALSFTIGGDTFTLANQTGNSYAQFTAGALTDVTFLGSENINTAIVSLQVNGDEYSFYDSGKGEQATGTFTASPATTAVTPEPGSLLLLGTGLMAGVGVVRRRVALGCGGRQG